MVSMKSNINAILFDLDDTLFDHTKAQNDVILRVTKNYPELFGNIDDRTILDVFRKADIIAVGEFDSGVPLDVVRLGRSKRFLGSLGIKADICEEITKKYIRSYSTVILPIEGAEKVIRSLHGKYKLGIVTNGSPEIQMYKLDSLNILKYLECKIYSEGVGASKPDPEIFLAATNKLDIAPARCLFVGNSYRDDVIGAKNVGMYTCWFNRHKEPVPTKETHHDYKISTLDELLDILAP